mmetsp:Transcript_70964/g.230373  ORF Transcript_70964/g.230373 Transcript_70964/m.230373 type:complete len:252 (+) Transcript_70964:1754-2509(+)
MRKARSTACASVAGFQAGSTSTTRSALVRFKPTPPTWVVKSMHWKRSISLLNLATFSLRAMQSVAPSMRRQRRLLGLSTQIWIKSNIFTLCEKISVRRPFAANFGNKEFKHFSLALCCNSASLSLGRFLSIISTALPLRASSCTAPAPSTAKLSEPSAETSGASAPSSSFDDRTAADSASDCSAAALPSDEATASDKCSAQAPGFGQGTMSAGWLQRRFSRPMARKTSTPSFCFSVASLMMSLFSKIFLYN